MAHMITIREDGTEEIAWSGQKPWHGLGVEMPKRMSAMHALVKANLDWMVTQEPICMCDATNNYIVITDKCANIRNDNGAYLGVVGDGYVPIQNEEQAKFIDTLVSEGNIIEVCGSLFGGRKTFWTIKVSNDLMVTPGDRIEQYLIATNSHDGSSPFLIWFSSIRVVCWNTLSAALRGMQTRVALRHTMNIKSRVEEAKKTLGLANKYFSSLRENLQALARIPLDHKGLGQYIETVFPTPEITTSRVAGVIYRRWELMCDRVLTSFESGPGAELAGRTLYGAYNAVTNVIDHDVTNRSDEFVQDRKFMSILDGKIQRTQQRAFDVAMKMAELS